MVCNAFHGIQSWWIFYYSVRNSVVPLLKALFARKRSGYTIAQACLNVLLLLWVWHALKRCLDNQCMCRYIRYTGIFEICLHIFLRTHPLQGMHLNSCMPSLFISVDGSGWGGSATLCRALVVGVGRYDFWTWGKKKGWSIFSSSVFFDKCEVYWLICFYYFVGNSVVALL